MCVCDREGERDGEREVDGFSLGSDHSRQLAVGFKLKTEEGRRQSIRQGWFGAGLLSVAAVDLWAPYHIMQNGDDELRHSVPCISTCLELRTLPH